MRYEVFGLVASCSIAGDVVVVDSRGTFGPLGRKPTGLTYLTRNGVREVVRFHEVAEDVGRWMLSELAYWLFGVPVADAVAGVQSPARGLARGRSVEFLRERYRPTGRGFSRFLKAAEYQRHARRIAPATPHLLLFSFPFTREAGCPTRLSFVPFRGR